MVLFRYLQYGFRDTMRSLWRHKGMVMVSVITVAIMLIVLGATVLLAANSEYMTNNMEEELEIIVFYDTAATRDEVLATEPYFQYITGFEQATFVSKEEAMEIMGEKLHQSNLTAATGGVNPLPDAFYIKVAQLEQIAPAVEFLNDKSYFPCVDLVRYGQDEVDNMIALSDTLERACMVVVVVMLFVALFLVNSTIRLTVATRGEEISIMKYVGATNVYVRIPFFLEGLIIGILGALIADVALYFGYDAVVEYIAQNAGFLDLMVNPGLMLLLMLILLVGGTLLGALGSNIAIRKYLRV
ncbi:MAG: permease-like cell division protein FtsX [Peptococcaceae bacterium]|nr:permease-like cell division protein FtsX [Peptococcaceae bacterium]MBO5365446.1 permease-like cell division protein FtsX [Peptococcaceae bacterium]MBP3584754.1 permease-like cell division protein FtsX [Peptococcaceae bacterium]MBQ2905837.1 permease-like cell division protein FtsX [Peptococcaceae bacterium]MBQ3120555.1 permease-like cell division protein FtsX [Peptococcaceae bacterium]